MVKITNGEITVEVTKGAFKSIFKPLGFTEVGEAETADSMDGSQTDQTDTHETEDTNTTAGENSAEAGETDTDEDGEDDEDDLSETPLSEMTKAELREYAAQNDIDLEGTADRKDDLIEAIKAALAK